MDIDWGKIYTSAVSFSHTSSGVILVSGLFHIESIQTKPPMFEHFDIG